MFNLNRRDSIDLQQLASYDGIILSVQKIGPDEFVVSPTTDKLHYRELEKIQRILLRLGGTRSIAQGSKSHFSSSVDVSMPAEKTA